jgi:hypothetical protein
LLYSKLLFHFNKVSAGSETHDGGSHGGLALLLVLAFMFQGAPSPSPSCVAFMLEDGSKKGGEFKVLNSKVLNWKQKC